jgi:ATP-binding cassette subfamily C protein
VAGAEGRAFTHWVQRYSSQVRLSSNIQKLKDFVGVFHSMLPTLSTALLYLFSYEMLLEARQPGQTSGLGLGSFLAFNVAFGTFLGGVLSLSQTAVGIQNLFVQAKRVQPILEAEPEIDEEKRDPGELTGRLAMDSVSFSYDSEGPRILDSVTMNAEPGEFVAIVGPSGSGKSTLFRMLLGFEAPQEGVVSFDGQDLASLDVLAVRRQLGVVLQGGRLDAGSVFDNIACGNVLTLDEAWAAAGDAGFADEVREMPMGMHTIVSVGGGNLSGGQRQRLLIARALAHRPKILIFDEATSALDNRTQAIVSESLERLKVTRIVVAHRLSTIRQADRIYVVEAGRIVQNGAFEELMAQSGGLFSRMMSRQLA